MAFNATEWDLSKEVVEEDVAPEEGPRYLFIKNADFDNDSQQYFIDVLDLNNNAEFTLRYWLNSSGNDNSIVPNRASRATLISLGVALAGRPIGIPKPSDIIGGVVEGTVVLKTSKTSGKSYPRIYTFNTAPAGVIDGFSNIGQFKLEDEETAAPQDKTAEGAEGSQ